MKKIRKFLFLFYRVFEAIGIYNWIFALISFELGIAFSKILFSLGTGPEICRAVTIFGFIASGMFSVLVWRNILTPMFNNFYISKIFHWMVFARAMHQIKMTDKNWGTLPIEDEEEIEMLEEAFFKIVHEQHIAKVPTDNRRVFRKARGLYRMWKPEIKKHKFKFKKKIL